MYEEDAKIYSYKAFNRKLEARIEKKKKIKPNLR